MQGRGAAARPPMGIAFEGDFGYRIDAALALAMLNGLAAKTESRTIATAISRSNIPTAQFADVIASFYAGRAVGGSAMIGMPERPPAEAAPAVAALLATKNDEGEPAFSSNIAKVIDTADNAVLIRNQLLAQHDGNATVVLAGPATGLARLLDLYGAVPQVAAKVKQLVLAIGSFGPGGAEASMKADVAAARKVFSEWPSPIVVVGAEVGEALPYPASSIEHDFDWSPAHPVVAAYKAFKPMPYDAPASALAALLYATHGDDGLFKVSEPGVVSVQADGTLKFAPSPEGRHRYLSVDPAKKVDVMALYTALVPAQPAPRGGRGFRGAAQQQNQQQAPAGRRGQPPAGRQNQPPAGRQNRPPVEEPQAPPDPANP